MKRLPRTLLLTDWEYRTLIAGLGYIAKVKRDSCFFVTDKKTAKEYRKLADDCLELQTRLEHQRRFPKAK
jgi:hypothetical protein